MLGGAKRQPLTRLVYRNAVDVALGHTRRESAL